MMQDYANMARQIMTLAMPVADKMNPLHEGLSSPVSGLEGARGYQGGVARLPIADIAHGESVMPGGRLTWPGSRELIREYANRPTPLPPIKVLRVDQSDPDAVRFWGGAKYFIEDGSHRLEAARLRGDKFIDAFIDN